MPRNCDVGNGKAHQSKVIGIPRESFANIGS